MQTRNEYLVRLLRVHQLLARTAKALALSALHESDYLSARDHSESARVHSERAAEIIREILG